MEGVVEMRSRAFWKNRNVLITGFEGFLGSNLTKMLLSYNANIVGIDIKTNRKHTILTKDDYKKIDVIQGDISNYRLIDNIFKKHEIHTVFHLAAEAIVGECNQNPLKAFASNIQGSWNVLEASRNNRTIKAIVCASSDKAYGSHEKLPYTEEASLIGNHPYDVSKSCADLIAYTYYHTYKLPVAVTRCGNIYGPGDFNFSRIVPDAMRCAASGETLLLRSDGKFTRDYVYVDDVVNGYIMLAEQLQKKKLAGEAFNFSDENPMAVLDLIRMIKKLSNKRLNYKILNKAKCEIKHQYLDSRKARKTLGWKPNVSLENGMKTAISWYCNYFTK